MSRILADIITELSERNERLEREVDWYAERAVQHQKEMQELRFATGVVLAEDGETLERANIRVKTMRDQIESLEATVARLTHDERQMAVTLAHMQQNLKRIADENGDLRMQNAALASMNDALLEQRGALLAWLDASWRGDTVGADDARRRFNDAAQTKDRV